MWYCKYYSRKLVLLGITPTTHHYNTAFAMIISTKMVCISTMSLRFSWLAYVLLQTNIVRGFLNSKWVFFRTICIISFLKKMKHKNDYGCNIIFCESWKKVDVWCVFVFAKSFKNSHFTHMCSNTWVLKFLKIKTHPHIWIWRTLCYFHTCPMYVCFV